MQVKNESLVPSYTADSKPLQLKEGEIHQAVVKEKLPNNEAVLQIKGQDVKVALEGDLPKGARVAVEVTGTDGPIPSVKSAVKAPGPGTGSAEASRQPLAGIEIPEKVKAETAKAAAMLMGKGVAISKQDLQNIAAFLEKGPGSMKDKMETLAAMGRKGLEFTPGQLKAVHEALHGSSISRAIEQLSGNSLVDKAPKVQTRVFNEKISFADLKQLGGTANLKDMIKHLNANGDSLPDSLKNLLGQAKQLSGAAESKILAAVKALNSKTLADTIAKMIQTGTAAEKILQFIKDDASTIPQGSLTDLLDAVKLEAIAQKNLLAGLESSNDESKAGPSVELQASLKAIRKDPDIQSVLSTIKDTLIDSEALSEPQAERVSQALRGAERLADSGREMAARQELLSVLDQVVQETAEKPSAGEVYELSDDFISSLPAHSKDFIVTEITKKMSQLSIDFKQIKRDIGKNLQTVEKLIDQFQNRAIPQAKPLLENTIKQLDNAILKSDVMLYTDMSTEKKLLKASTQLAEAKRMLEKGEVSNASRVVSEVRNMVDKLIFKPSDVRVQHFVSKQLLQLEQPGLQQLAASYENSLHAAKEMPSGRQILEHMRNLGLTYESDQAQALVQKGKADADSTLKGAMLKLMQNEGDHQLVQKADQLTANLTGQQLLSKSDPSGLQTMMLTIPYLLQDKAEDVKVFIQSKNNEQQIDWENCSLYFLLETKKLGDVGILLSAVDRTLSLTIKNDSPKFKEKIEPLAVMAQDKLKEIGYNVGKIQFTPFTAADSAMGEKEAAPAKTKTPGFSERGYDFTI
ncbi:hypothetical protein B9K06_12840 [Bacillus sp. OG2]|nr:hypothetical protein B9K06_12840 [Bacillus sp. OG2]